VRNQGSVVSDQRSEKPSTTEVAIDPGEGPNTARTLARWLKFNAVGAVGMVVQLGSLAVLNRWMAGRYLEATALAIEITLLHNFFWHVRYTWKDRRGAGGLAAQAMRFHLSNGLVSMVGNLALMPVLVGLMGMPVLVANGVAVLGCSLVNFWLGDGWVFARSRSA
jgi:putative flippase GtrA